MLLMAGTGWLVQMILSRWKLPAYQQYWQELSLVMVVGVSFLLPYSLAQLLLDTVPIWIPIVSVLLSSGNKSFLRLLAVLPSAASA